MPTLPVALMALGLGACGGEAADPGTAFENLEVRVEALGGRAVRLEERRALLDDESVEIVLDDLHLTGVLDTPGAPVTTGILYTTRGGAETQTELVVARQVDGELTHVSSLSLGERMRVEGIRYQEGEIIVHVLDYGPADPPCCPSVAYERRFVLEEGGLRER